jgi:RNA polymerase sigma factor (sigma-70 family)
MSMPHRQWQPLLGFLHQVAAPRSARAASDVHLLERFRAAGEEAAFATLMQRHGPMVYDVCRRVLDDPHAAEDAFQATFLVLVRKAGVIRRPDLLANWLYGVAYRTALKARTEAARRRLHERQFVAMPTLEPATEVLWRDLRPVLDEEIDRLPARYRAPFVLCCLEGRTKEETAGQLGLPAGTVSSRLARARDRLRTRLVRRGIALSTGLLATQLAENVAAAVPGPLAHSTLKAAMLVAAGNATVGAVSGPVAALTQGVLQAMFLTKLKTVAAALLALTVLGTGLGVGTYRSRAGDPAAEATDLPARQAARRDDAPPERSPLHGVWRVVSVEIDGEKLAPQENARWVIAERHINRYQGDRSIGRWTYELEGVNGSPSAIDLIPPDGSARLHGIYDVQRDSLTVCYSAGVRARPTRFASTPGSGLVLFTLKRPQPAESRALPPQRTAEADERDDREAIQGTWILTYSERNGARQQTGQGDSGTPAKWLIGRDTIRWADTAHKGREWRYRIDPRRRPKWFDLSAPEINQALPGIYALHDDKLVLCISVSGRPTGQPTGPAVAPQYDSRAQYDSRQQDSSRPQAFRTAGSDRTILWILRRANGAAADAHAGRGRLAAEREALKKEVDEETAAIAALQQRIVEMKQRRAEEARHRAEEEAARQREEGEVARLLLENIRLREQVQQLRKELRRLRDEQKSLEDPDRPRGDGTPRY